MWRRPPGVFLLIHFRQRASSLVCLYHLCLLFLSLLCFVAVVAVVVVADVANVYQLLHGGEHKGYCRHTWARVQPPGGGKVRDLQGEGKGLGLQGGGEDFGAPGGGFPPPWAQKIKRFSSQWSTNS